MKPMRIAQIVLLSLLTFALVTCSSDNDDADRRPQSYPRGGDGARRGGFTGTTAAGDGLEMMPPSDWWRDPQIAVAVNLTNDQIASLDRISHEQSEEIAKLDRDSMTAVRDLREVLNSSQPSTADIASAGQRLRGIRDVLFDRRVQMVAAERTLLTQQQWTALQRQLTESRNRPDRNDRGGNGNRGRGGRGGMGGRGRFPG
jgi:Spy/CpxP family protein refolding chaperone